MSDGGLLPEPTNMAEDPLLVARESRRSVTGSLPGRVCVTDGGE